MGLQAYAIVTVVSDTELVLKAPGLPLPLDKPTPYKIQPKIDQAAVYDQVRRAIPLARPPVRPPRSRAPPPSPRALTYPPTAALQVFKRLSERGAVGIFPEGGSHDRTELLPLKAGFTIMALGTLARHPDLPLYIVPTGLYYFRAHAFRSKEPAAQYMDWPPG